MFAKRRHLRTLLLSALLAGSLSVPALAVQGFVIHSFTGGPSDGAEPYAGLVEDTRGNLYGTTTGGGNPTCAPHGCGTVFRLTPAAHGYAESIVHVFRNTPGDGAHPYGKLLIANDGTLYGTTAGGGSAGFGTVFHIAAHGSSYDERVLYDFKGGADGSRPLAELIMDARGVLFGTTVDGGGTGCAIMTYLGCGTAFALEPNKNGYVEHVIYRFAGLPQHDGSNPRGGLTLDGAGDLYGTTQYGGIDSLSTYGAGTLFELIPAASGYSENVVHRFGGDEGFNPEGTLAFDARGALYGTTVSGFEAGNVFRFTQRDGKAFVTNIFAFGIMDGGFPASGLAIDPRGTMYGTTPSAGAGPNPCGTLYTLVPSGPGYVQTVLKNFRCTGADGAAPFDTPLVDAAGNIFITTRKGGGGPCHDGCGAVYEIKRR